MSYQQGIHNVKRWRRVLFVLVALLLVLGVMVMGNWFSKTPTGLGVTNGRLAPCPDSPNCVCSQDEREPHHVEPFHFEGDAAAAFSRLVGVLKSWPRARIVEQTDRYLHVEFTTPWLRFVDEGEFLLKPEENAIHVRSAARLGRTDFGVNRKRMEKLRTAFAGPGN